MSQQQIQMEFQSKYWQIGNNTANTISCLEKYASHYKTNHVMITAGNDFAFKFAEVNYQFLENATQAINKNANGRKFKFMYSTVDEYMKATSKKA